MPTPLQAPPTARPADSARAPLREPPNTDSVDGFIAFSDALSDVLNGIPGIAVTERRFGWSARSKELTTFTDYRITTEEGRAGLSELYRMRPLSSFAEIERVLRSSRDMTPKVSSESSLFYIIESGAPMPVAAAYVFRFIHAFGITAVNGPPIMGSMSFHQPDEKPDELVRYYERLRG